MANGHGGARPGAGRKAKAEKFESQIARADQLAADNLVLNIETLQELATFDREVVHEVWEPAGTVLIDDVLRDSLGKPILDDKGKPTRIKRQAFPDKPADEPVLIQRRVVRSGPSETAAIYLVDRIAGKPVQATEVSGPDGGAIPLSIEQAVARVYGDDEDGE